MLFIAWKSIAVSSFWKSNDVFLFSNKIDFFCFKEELLGGLINKLL
jgi:hypothetical protein